jgi:cobalamin biosynthesis protein CobD/CbiB
MVFSKNRYNSQLFPAWRIFQRDRKNMASLNAGWSISVMAGTLNIQPEKPGCYTIGNNSNLLPKYITKALCMMLLTAALFTVSIIVPLLALKKLITILIL